MTVTRLTNSPTMEASRSFPCVKGFFDMPPYEVIDFLEVFFSIFLKRRPTKAIFIDS